MSAPSCLLFFPATRPELLPKALASGAGLVCIDLEDAVAAEAKGRARRSVVELLGEAAETDGGRLAVRVNHPSTPDGVRDLDALRTLTDRPTDPYQPVVVIPKVSTAADVAGVLDGLGAASHDRPVLAMIETVAGLSRVEEIAAEERVAGLVFGGLDLSGELGCELSWEPLLYARSRCVVAARLAGVGLVDTPYFDLNDEAGLRAEAARARALGFTGKAAIHPRQVAAIQEVFAPTGEEIAAARRVLAAQERLGGGAFAMEGVMIDRPVVEAARRLLEQAEADDPSRGAGA